MESYRDGGEEGREAETKGEGGREGAVYFIW